MTNFDALNAKFVANRKENDRHEPLRLFYRQSNAGFVEETSVT